MSRAFNGSSDYLRAAACTTSAFPLTFACWLNPAAITDTQLFGIFNTSANTHLISLTMDTGQAGIVVYEPDQGVTFNFAAATQNPVTNRWQHLAGVCRTSTDRDAWLNGRNKGVNVGTACTALTGINATTIGRLDRPSSGGYFNGQLAECAIWTAALTEQEIVALAQGCRPPLIRPESLVCYVPLGAKDELSDYKALSFTLNGTQPRQTPPALYSARAFPLGARL